MPMKRLSMRKIKEVLRLRYELGLGQRQIACSCSIGQATVQEYLKRAQAAGVTWPLPEGWNDRRLEEALYGPAPRRVYESRKPAPDFAQLHEELQRHRHLTLQLAWEEYRQAPPGRLRLQPVLRTLPALAAATGCGITSGAQGRREALRRLRRGHDPPPRPARWPSAPSVDLRGGPGSQ